MPMGACGVLQLEFEEMNGWNADSEAATLLSNLEFLKVCIMRKCPIWTENKKYVYFWLKPCWYSRCVDYGRAHQRSGL